jgi:long-chain fatty acid transport protein
MDWGASGPFAFGVTEAELTVMNFAPTVAVRINDRLSIGASLNVYHGDTTLKFNYSPLLPGSLFRFEADGAAVGATVGVRWQIHEQHAVAAVFRSPFRIDLEGDAAIGNAGPFNVQSPARAAFEFPMCVAVGYAFWPVEKLKLEVNVDWTHWDTLNVVRLRSPNPTFSGDPRATIPFHWEDSFFYEFGAQYRLSEPWVLRAGYIFSENTVPTTTFGPLVPDSDRHVFSVGVGYETGRLTGHLTYQYSLSEDRTIPAANPFGAGGRWESEAHAIVLTSSIRF